MVMMKKNTYTRVPANVVAVGTAMLRDGISISAVSRQLSVSYPTVSKWKQRLNLQPVPSQTATPIMGVVAPIMKEPERRETEVVTAETLLEKVTKLLVEGREIEKEGALSAEIVLDKVTKLIAKGREIERRGTQVSAENVLEKVSTLLAKGLEVVLTQDRDRIIVRLMGCETPPITTQNVTAPLAILDAIGKWEREAQTN